MKSKKLVKTMGYSVAILSMFVLSHAALADQADNSIDNTKVSETSIPKVDPSSPEYIEVSTEAEFRDAVESDNGKTYIKMTANIQLLDGVVTVPASKANLTIDSHHLNGLGNDAHYVLRSGHPIQVTDITKQKMLSVDNPNTKEINFTDVAIVNAFIAGAVTINDSYSNVVVNFNNTTVHGPAAAVNRNGVVNYTGNNTAYLSNTYNDLTVVHSRGLTEANVVNVYGDLTVGDWEVKDGQYRTVFRMFASNGHTPVLNFMPNSKVSVPTDSPYDFGGSIQSLFWSETAPSNVNLMKGADVNVKIVEALHNVWGAANMIVDNGASLVVERKPLPTAPDAHVYSTITPTKGFTAKKGSNVVIKNDPDSNITGHAIEVGSGGVIDILQPNNFDISGPQTTGLFGSSAGGSLLNISAATSIKGWNNLSLTNPSHSVSGPLNVQYSLYGDQTTLISSSVDNFANLFPLETQHRLVVD